MSFAEGVWFWGMHVFWWIFWILLIAVFFAAVRPVPRHKLREAPLQILQRRYAAGEISTSEYEERKAHLRSEPASATK